MAEQPQNKAPISNKLPIDMVCNSKQCKGKVTPHTPLTVVRKVGGDYWVCSVCHEKTKSS